MRLRDTTSSFGLPSRALHWASAGLIAVAWVVGSLMEDVPRGATRDTTMALHYTLGLGVLSLVAVRLLWRLANPRQAPEPGVPAWQDTAGRWMHWALYGLMVLLPFTGLLDRWARGRPMRILWGPAVPAPFAIPGDKIWGEVHEVLGNVLLAAVAVHVLAALWHHFVRHDGVLRRMWGGPAVAQAQTPSA